MYEKIKQFFSRHWPWFLTTIGIGLFLVFGFRYCARSFDIVIKNCKTTINEVVKQNV